MGLRCEAFDLFPFSFHLFFRKKALTFQLQELESLSLQAGEVEELHVERQKLQNSGRLAEGTSAALDGLFDNENGNANSLIADALRSIELLADVDPALSPVVELLGGANIQVAEAVDFGEVMIGGEEIQEIYVKNLGDATFSRHFQGGIAPLT